MVGGEYLSFPGTLFGLEADACAVPLQENQAFHAQRSIASQGPLVSLDFQD